ncbi:MAG: ABC transporter permease [Thermoguttaceae bacterium]
MKKFLKQWSGPGSRALCALILVLLLGFIFSGNGAFWKGGTHTDALRQSSVYGILAVGMTLVIITGGIDLSVGSVLAVCAVSFSLFSIHWGWSALAAISATLILGICCGTISGSLTARLKIQPFIATLAMMVFARGLAKYISGGMKVSTAVQQPDGTYSFVELPTLFRMIDRKVLGDNITVVSLIFLACFLLCWILLSRHQFGRSLYAIGGNEEAARLSGVPVCLYKTLAYTLSGVCAAIAGICQAAQETQGDPETGTGYELSAIAMVVIGGTSLAGGRGGLGLTFLGVLTIGYLEKILSINAIPESGRLMLTGIIVIIAVLAQRQKR